MGSRQFGIVPIAISLCASFNSAYMILGIPGEVYSYGTQFLVMILGTGLGVVVSAELWLPILYKLNIVSIYEYFELRYNSKFPRVIMSIIFLLKVGTIQNVSRTFIRFCTSFTICKLWLKGRVKTINSLVQRF